MIGLRVNMQLIRNFVSALGSRTMPAKTSFIPGRYYRHQESLPFLPVPPLQKTLEKYLKAVRPLVNDDEFRKTEKLVKEFGQAGGIGEKLQLNLEKRFKEKENWLSDWWLEQAYLLSRGSVVVNCSPSVSFPRYTFKGTEGQVQQAAKVIAAILQYKTIIDNETLPVEKLGGKDLCMDQYYRILSTCRIPGVDRDKIVSYAKSWKPPKHITVIYKNRFFELPVYDESGEPLSINHLENQLKNIVSTPGNVEDAVGILTGLDRDRWGKVFKALCQDDNNKAVLMSIQRSIFALCLDQSPEFTTKNWRSEFALNCLHGGGSCLNTGNRWFDKTIQMVVNDCGGVGLVYEHAPAEGPPIAALLDHVFKFCENPVETSNTTDITLLPVRELKFNVSEEIRSAIGEAAGFVDKLSSTVQLEVVDFKDFGKDFIKSQKMSPDSFIQIAFQLSYWRLHRKQPATYESASLRQFRLGRTDTIRSCSIESQSFVENMDSAKVSLNDKAQMLRAAVSSHRKYVMEAVNGNGIDRHLLGFRLAALEEEMPVPEIIKDESYKRSMHFNLSTSQVPSQADLCMAFGPAVLDGYGLCYNPKKDKILVSISTFDSNPDYSPAVFSKEMQKSFCDMKDLLLSCAAKL